MPVHARSSPVAPDLAGRPGTSPRRILILARSGRMLAASARAAGWLPAVIDQFGDEDTRQLATACWTVAAGAELAFDRDETLASVARAQRDDGQHPIVLGAGFEDAAPLVAALAARYRVLGSDAQTLAALARRPSALARLASAPEIRVPATVEGPLRDGRGWLAKRNGSCGGIHVSALAGAVTRSPDVYFQRAIGGRSLSMLYLAGADGCTVCAVFEHLRWHPAPAHSYRYEGAVCVAAPDTELLAAGSEAGWTVAREFGLRGCFGLDFIQHPAGSLYLVDINPRPPATLDLLADKGAVFAAHVAACARGALLYSRPPIRPARAHLVLYAERRWRVPRGFDWPAWTADRPLPGTVVAGGEPLCTLLAVARNRPAACATLGERYAALRARFGNASNSPLPATITVRMMGDPANG